MWDVPEKKRKKFECWLKIFPLNFKSSIDLSFCLVGLLPLFRPCDDALSFKYGILAFKSVSKSRMHLNEEFVDG